MKNLSKKTQLALNSFCLIIFMLISSNLLSQGTPSNVLPDLQYFKLTFPLDANGNDYEGVSYNDRDDPLIKAWERDNLVGWSPNNTYGAYFFVSGNDVVFRAHCAGALTSANSYPRCELRETPNGTDDLWEFSDEHELNATFRITNLPNEKEEVCVLQIKGNDSNNTSGTEEAFRLEYRQDGSQGVHVTINEDETVPDIMDYSVGQTIVSRMYVNNGEITIELNNTSVSGSRGQWNFTYDSDYSHGYFKAGCYTQSSIWEEKNGVADESPNAYGEVRFSELTMGSSGSTCSPGTPGNRSNGNVGNSSATVSWNSVAGINHYKVRHRVNGSSSWVTSPTIPASNTSYTITGLSSNTTYNWQVRSKCADNSGSNYSSGQGPNFTTSGGGSSLPSPWQTTDIGNVAANGNATFSNGTFNISGSGNDIWNNADEFRYVYQSLNGDGEIIAQVNSLSNTNAWAKAGVMIRASLSAGSKHAMTVITPSRGASFQRRTSTNGGSSHNTVGSPRTPEYVRLVRSGNSFSSYYSGNGSNWTKIGNNVTVTMGSSVYIGLCLTSHNDGTIANAAIKNVSINTGSNNSNVNLALNKPTDQSSTGYGGESPRAVDGNTNGSWSVGSVTHTNSGTNNWWEVDLSGNYNIGDIKIFNRTDNCCKWRLGNFTVSVENSNGNVVWSQTVTSPPNPSITLNANGVLGRTVRIDQNLNAPLSLAEVEVYGSSSSSRVQHNNPLDLGNVFNSVDNDQIKTLKLFPNPASNEINISGLGNGENIRVFNSFGALIIKTKNTRINIANLQSGIYFIKVDGFDVRKLLKQ